MKRYNVMQAKEQNDGVWVRYNDAAATLSARDAEIERLKARVALLEGAMQADEARLMEAAQLAGVGYFGCDTPEVMADTIGELRALVEQRERQLVYCVRRGAWSQTDPEPFVRDVTTRPASHVRFGDDALSVEYDGTDAGLLAAVDEATEPR